MQSRREPGGKWSCLPSIFDLTAALGACHLCEIVKFINTGEAFFLSQSKRLDVNSLVILSLL